MSFRTQQRLRTRQPMETVDGEAIPANTQVSVISMERGRLRVAIVDSQYPQWYRKRIVASPGKFAKVARGRPRRKVG